MLAKTYGWTLDYINALEIEDLMGLCWAIEEENKINEKEYRKAQRGLNRKR